MPIDFEVKDKIATIVINRPEALNSMTQPMYKALSDAWIEVRDNPDIWVAVVTGAPQPSRPPERQVFTAGADLRSMNRERGVDSIAANPDSGLSEPCGCRAARNH